MSHQEAIKTSIYSLIGNIFLALIKALAGFFGHSYALIADAIESTTDVFASLLVVLGFKYAQRPADENHPYGHGKIEPLITFLVVGFLITSATIIAYTSIIHIQNPHKAPAAWTLWVLGAIILWKELSYRWVIFKAKGLASTALKAEAWHHRSDAITSVLAALGIGVSLVFGEGYESADDWAALAASVFIVYNSYLIFRPALAEVMDEQQHHELEAQIHREAQRVVGVINTEKCHIRKSGMQYQVDLHARVDGQLSVQEGHRIAHALKDHLHQEIPNLNHILIHIEPH